MIIAIKGKNSVHCVAAMVKQLAKGTRGLSASGLLAINGVEGLVHKHAKGHISICPPWEDHFV